MGICMIGMQYALPGLLLLMMLFVFGVAAGIMLVPVILVIWLSSHVFQTASHVSDRRLRWLAVGLTLLADLYTFISVDILVATQFNYYLAFWPFQLKLSHGLYANIAIALVSILTAAAIISKNCVYPSYVTDPPDILGTLRNILFFGLLLGSIALSFYVGYWYGALNGIGMFAALVAAGWLLETLFRAVARP
jgi:hypothetical protein